MEEGPLTDATGKETHCLVNLKNGHRVDSWGIKGKGDLGQTSCGKTIFEFGEQRGGKLFFLEQRGQLGRLF